MKKFILKWIYRITAINNRKVLLRVANLPANGTVRITKDEEKLQIGRASCRERVCQYV